MDLGSWRIIGDEQQPVALVAWTSFPDLGGVPQYLAGLTELLARQGRSVVLLTGTRGFDSIEGVQVEYLPVLDLDPRGEEPELSVVEAQFRKVLERHGIRVVHGHNLHYRRPQVAQALVNLRDASHTDARRLTLVHTYHSPADENGRAEWAEFVAPWDVHYGVSQHISDHYARELSVPVHPVRIGIDLERFAAAAALRGLRRGREPVRFLLPARLVEGKGARVAVEAMRILVERCRDEGLPLPHLVLTASPDSSEFRGQGGGAFRQELEEKVDAWGLTGLVSFRNAPSDLMPGIMADADVGLMPSTGGEALGLTSAEMQSAGRPVVVSDMGGLPETLLPGETGFVVPHGDAQALADAMYPFVRRPELAVTMGEKARRFAARRFDQRRHAVGVGAVYFAANHMTYKPPKFARGGHSSPARGSAVGPRNEAGGPGLRRTKER